MVHETIAIREKGSLDYARLITYIWEDSPEIPVKSRPIVLICPGGGYEMTSDREAEAVALRIMTCGIHAVVLRYSCAPAEYPTALCELARAVAILREHAQEWHIQADKLSVMGFSAGGHLAASYGVFWNSRELVVATGIEAETLGPNGLILCYPVITTDERFWHRDSIKNLLGSQWSEQMLEKVSLEKQVGQQVPRTFLWHTCEDGLVPVENSLLFVSALRRAGVPVEFHLFEKGVHGLSLARPHTDSVWSPTVQKECEPWIDLLETWLGNL